MSCVLITPMIILCSVPCPCFVDGSGRGLKKQSPCTFERTVPPLIGMEVTVWNNLLNVQCRRGTSSTFELRVPPLIAMEVNSNSYLYGPTFQMCDSRGWGGGGISRVNFKCHVNIAWSSGHKKTMT